LEAVILAGGLGTRLREAVPDLPKPMAPIAGKPFLEILLAKLADDGVSRVVLSVGHLANKITDYFGPRYGTMELIYEVENAPLGTGGALRNALARCVEDHALVLNGDTFLEFDMPTVEALWLLHRNPIILARHVDETARYGRLFETAGRITGFAEKGFGGAGLINAGSYVLPRDVMKECQLKPPFSFESDFLKREVAQRKFEILVVNGNFIDIGVPEDYARAKAQIRID
jgi:D-glycero-alpha-D-manno-heptose 1-phosphate guanylyltransferase